MPASLSTWTDQIMEISSRLQAPFLRRGKVDKLLLSLFLAINLLVLTNSVLHNPEIGYDGTEHLKYIQALPYRLPTEADTREFFSAPLPYFLPSLVNEACHRLSGASEVAGTIDDCLRAAGKFAQIINFILSLGVTFLFIQIGEVVRPGNRFLKISSLALLGVMTVYYKTFSQVRGEPYLLFFCVWAIYLVAQIISARERVSWRSGVLPGIALGAMLLSRQWGFMLIPALAGLWALVWVLEANNRWQFTKALIACAVTAFLLCGWFYFSLTIRYGTFLAFNRSPMAFSFSNQPTSFYRNTGLKGFLLFKSPIRGTFNNQFIPIFYSDIWGDYWGHFVFIQDRSYLGELGYGNREQIAPFLGRVNAVSLYPSLIFLAGMVLSGFSLVRYFRGNALEKSRSLFYKFLFMFMMLSFLLFFYFLIVYPIPDQGDTIKAAYLLHALVVLPLLGAEFLEKVRVRYPRVYLIGLALLGLVFMHNLPAMITRYRVLFYQ